jgi:hypothetical protein
MSTEQEKHILAAAMIELRANFGVPQKCRCYIVFDEYPQLNDDGSKTHDIKLEIENTKYDVEVYERNGKYTADCWKVNEVLTDSLVFEC